MELSKTKIQVTAICPCDIKTNFTKNRIKSYETNERYGLAIQKSAEKIDSREDKRMSLEKAIKIMTKIINKKKVELKYLIGFTKENPTVYDLLYELISFLEAEAKDEFNEWELKNKTKSSFGSLEENFQVLIDEGYIEKGKYTKYKLLKNKWV